MKKIIIFLFIIINALIVHAEPVKLITDASQLWSDCGYTGDAPGTGDSQPISVLVDGNPNTHWHSDYLPADNPNSVKHEHYFDVIFPDGLVLEANDSIVVMLQRRASMTAGHPMTFEIRGSDDPASVAAPPATWIDGFRYAFFTYRGPKTIEYTARIPLITGKRYYRLRFILKANNSKSFSPAGYRYMHLAEFQIYKLTGNDQYPGIMADRFHLKTDMNFGYADYTLLRTGGILDPKVRDGVSDLNGWIGATPGFDPSTGKWTQNLDFFEKYKDRLSAPDYTQVSSATDSRIKTGVKYQPAHVTEHVLYAIPGDAIALYPFYGFNTITQYEEKFSHWYNYETGGHVTDSKGNRLLDFLIDPSGIAVSNEYGWYGGSSMRYSTIKPARTYNIYTVDDYKDFVAVCNGGEYRSVGILHNDLDFAGITDIDPIGTMDQPFVGCFNGNGHVFRNLKISKEDVKGVGIFGCISAGAVIENLILDSSCSIVGNEYVGVIGAYNNGNYSVMGTKTATILNIINRGSVEGKGEDSCTGGILGSVRYAGSIPVSLTFSNCAFTGTLIGRHADGLVSGWITGSTIVRFENCYTTGTFTNESYFQGHQFACLGDESTQRNFDRCFSTLSGDSGIQGMIAEEANTPEFIAKIGGNWQVGTSFPTTRVEDRYDPEVMITNVQGSRLYGTIATFFYPRDVTQHQLQDFDKEDYYIAADFSQDLVFDKYCDSKNKTILEPLINFRHIFHIKSGKKFADDNCSTKEKNEAFIRKNRRHVTAEAGKYFQIRLDAPIPVETTTRSILYYKIDDTDYRRVCSMRIRVKDSAGNILKEVTDANNLSDANSFFASETFNGYGTREIDGITYNACGGGGSYYRMLACNANQAQEGTYIVQIIGLDYNGNKIIIPDGSGAELLIQEFEITFLPKTAAVLVPEEDLKKDEYRRVANDWLTTNYGAPRDRIDYDQYMLYNELDKDERAKYLDMNNSKGIGRSKWPVKWATSNYSFAYSNHHDFNMYQVANHSDRVIYHGKPSANMPAEKNFGTGMNGLFDRRFYDTQGAQRGFFYWVNASADPGVMGYLHLDDFCAGSTVHVSGWISEFSGGERANLTLNFIAVLNDGDRVPLHSHTTGYVPDDDTMGTWLYFYASFVPIFTDKDFDIKDVDHYEIELDNNCKNSGGADYAIDDIRVYLVKPVVYADQAEPICTQTTKAEIKISAPFDVLMQSLGKVAAADAAHGENLNLYYSFVDYNKYNGLIAEGKSSDDAFDGAVLRYNYRGDTENYFGKISFNTFFPGNEEYRSAGDKLSGHAFRETVNGVNMIAFNTRPEDSTMGSGKEYMVVLYLPNKDEVFADGQGPTAAQYQIGSFGKDNDCSKSCLFRVMAAHSIKIDGEVKNPDEIIESCRNQSPVVQVDLYGQFDDSVELIEKNARFDWFAGSMDEFSQIKEGDVSLWDAMIHFRQYYSAADGLENCEPTGIFTEADRDIIDRYSRTDPTGETKPRLILSQRSYVFPPLILDNGQQERKEYVLAVPIPVVKEGDVNDYLICTEPTEVRVTVRQRAPRLKHGFEDIKYPAAIDDVPLRVSLAELKKVSTATTDPAEIAAHRYLLEIPIYELSVVTDGVTGMRIPGAGSPIFIVQTDDPEYRNLNFDSPVGELRSLDAEKGKPTNRFCAVFYGNHINFKEGYTYRFRFTFEENNTDTGIAGEEICTGQDVFTIKVVPEYQKWTGIVNLNWNNDGNWRRVASDEMYSAASEFTSDGANDNSGSFAPLDFTKVIIPQGKTFPHLFKETTLSVDNYDWANQPSQDPAAGDATVLVQYDMAQLLRPDAEGLFCRPWYAHTCDQIHFEPRSQISGQQFMHYNRAWVDMEMEPSLWLTASSPLQGVVAGDMYLPSDNARQSTAYFDDIFFDAGKNNRFKPAVFQRSWNQASATVYRYPGHDGDTEDVTVRTTWSRVYNDVRVPYSPGHGFSVRNDLSKYDGDAIPGKVLFRLPKADAFFDYYTTDGNTGDNTIINRTNPGRLCFDENTAAPLSAVIEAATDDNKFFLVGNPFMAHLNMVKFFEGNQNIQAKYWVLTSALQGAAVMSPEGTMVGSTGDEPNYLPPFAGFFVEAKNPGRQLKINFTADMMSVPEFASRSRASEAYEGLRITAVESGSTALIFTTPASEAMYEESEDALFINDDTLDAGAGVYTCVGGHAMTVNVCPEIEGTEVGIAAGESSTVTLRFEGIDENDGLMLYDALENVYHPLADGSEISVVGAAKGRLYLVSERIKTSGNSIVMNLVGRKLTVTSVAGGLMVKVYNTMGAVIDSNDDGDMKAGFTLPQGICIVEASDNESTSTRKFLVQ